MGDRANVFVQVAERTVTNPGHVVFYTHWGGYKLPIAVKKALSKRERWDDPSYLARIIFCQMTEGRWDETTGFGISTEIGDNEHNLLYVWPDTNSWKLVGIYPESRLAEVEAGQWRDPIKSWTFEEFINTSDEVILKFWMKEEA